MRLEFIPAEDNTAEGHSPTTNVGAEWSLAPGETQDLVQQDFDESNFMTEDDSTEDVDLLEDQEGEGNMEGDAEAFDRPSPNSEAPPQLLGHWKASFVSETVSDLLMPNGSVDARLTSSLTQQPRAEWATVFEKAELRLPNSMVPKNLKISDENWALESDLDVRETKIISVDPDHPLLQRTLFKTHDRLHREKGLRQTWAEIQPLHKAGRDNHRQEQSKNLQALLAHAQSTAASEYGRTF